MKKQVLLVFIILLFGCGDNEPKIKRIDGSQISKPQLLAIIESLIDTAKVTGI